MNRRIFGPLRISGRPSVSLFDIWVGIATLKDEIYFIDGANKKGNCYVKETERGFLKLKKL